MIGLPASASKDLRSQSTFGGRGLVLLLVKFQHRYHL